MTNASLSTMITTEWTLIAERWTTTEATSYRRGATDAQIDRLLSEGVEIDRVKASQTERGWTRRGVAIYARRAVSA